MANNYTVTKTINNKERGKPRLSFRKGRISPQLKVNSL